MRIGKIANQTIVEDGSSTAGLIGGLKPVDSELLDLVVFRKLSGAVDGKDEKSPLPSEPVQRGSRVRISGSLPVRVQCEA